MPEFSRNELVLPETPTFHTISEELLHAYQEQVKLQKNKVVVHAIRCHYKIQCTGGWNSPDKLLPAKDIANIILEFPGQVLYG